MVPVMLVKKGGQIPYYDNYFVRIFFDLYFDIRTSCDGIYKTNYLEVLNFNISIVHR